MKKIFTVLALLSTCALASAQGIANHPDARNDRVPSSYAEKSTHVGTRADHGHAKRHSHARKHHHKM